MKKVLRYINVWAPILISLLVPILVYSYAEGPPAGVTGATVPPPGEGTCIECHGTTLNSGKGSVVIDAPSSYSSGITYPITVTVSDPATTQMRWGFELSARTTPGGQQAGNFTPGSDCFTQVITFTDADPRTCTDPTQSLTGLQYIGHTFVGTRWGTRGGASFNFTWTAPDISAGAIVFNAAGNAANGDGFNDPQDHIYASAVTVQPGAPPPAPVLPPQSVVSDATFAVGTNPVAPGMIVAIFGSNLDDGSINPTSQFDGNGNLVTTLGSATVTFNGMPAPIFAAIPGQLNVMVPFELAGATSASVQVTVNGQSSATQTVAIAPAMPGIFTFAQSGAGQGVVQIANTSLEAAPTGSISGLSSRPANPGEFVTIYCTGLGAVINQPATGAPSPGNPLATTVASVQVSIGGITTPGTAALVPGFVALYQVNAQMPAGAQAGSAVPVVVTIGGQQSNTAAIAVGP